ncbi:AtpZ/AtpI family protein [Sporomusa aerivorans]|uniref:AtpZ/AtpI family protein n=1 Tax=Sporomusa aerivorans TaxID=204936 RepID=UPI003529EED1
MPEKRNGVWSALSLAGTIGLNMAATVAVGLFLGRWTDNYFATSPWFTVSGIIAGMIAGLWSTYKKIVKL